MGIVVFLMVAGGLLTGGAWSVAQRRPRTRTTVVTAAVLAVLAVASVLSGVLRLPWK